MANVITDGNQRSGIAILAPRQAWPPVEKAMRVDHVDNQSLPRRQKAVRTS
jgi:hypothetical protein